MQKLTKILVFFIALLAAKTSFADASEFGSDGLSDPNLINITEEGLDWSYLDSSTSWSTNVDQGTLGERGDHLITGAWSQTSISEIGVASKKRNGTVTWTVKNSNGGTASVDFGDSKDRALIAGADFNGNGTTDAARIPVSGQAEIYLDPFNGGSVLSGFNFTKGEVKNGQALFLNRNGSNDELSIYYSRKNQRKLISIDSNGIKTTTRFPARRNRVLDAMPIQNTSGSDDILVVERQGKKKLARVYDLSGNLIRSEKLPKKATVIVGEYFASDPGQEYAHYSEDTGRFGIRNPYSDIELQIDIVSGRVIADLVNVFTFRNSSNSSSSGSSGGGSGLGAVCPGGTTGLPPGVLWKPAADASDAREGKPVVLFTGSRKPGGGNIMVYAANGAEVCNFTFKASSIPGVNGGADHYFSGWSGGCARTCSAISTLARQTAGSQDVYFQGRGGVCHTVPNPCGRYGGI